MNHALLVRADARCLPIADNSVDLIVTSPPYFGLRSYTDGGEHYAGQIGSEPSPVAFVDELVKCTAEWARVLKPTGSMFVNIGDKYSDRAGPSWRGSSDRFTSRPDKPRRPSSTSMAPRKSLLGTPWRYALRCIDDLGLTLREDVIWAKPNAMPESVADRCRRSHEYLFHFTLGEEYYAAIDEIREPHSGGSHSGRIDKGVSPRNAAIALHGDHGLRRSNTDPSVFNPRGRLPGSVWNIASEPFRPPPHLDVKHFAAFPTELPRRIILGWSPPGGVVLDPFGGTGTTALVATAHGRYGVSVDLSGDYCRLARWRTCDRREIARAMRVDRPPTETSGQDDLFSEASA